MGRPSSTTAPWAPASWRPSSALSAGGGRARSPRHRATALPLAASVRIFLPVSHVNAPGRLYRAMKRGQDGRPSCGDGANHLGVRPNFDIAVDDGSVRPATGGLSTTPDDPRLLPPHVRPPSLGGLGKLPVFVLDVASLGAELTARRDPVHPRQHAFIEPACIMLLTKLQALLCDGRTAWEVVS